MSASIGLSAASAKSREFPSFFKIPTVQQSPEEETPFVYVTLATHVTLATAGYTPCLFWYVTIGLTRHNRTHFSQSERLLVKPQRPCTDLCAEPAGVWNRLLAWAIASRMRTHCQTWHRPFTVSFTLRLNKLPTEPSGSERDRVTV